MGREGRVDEGLVRIYLNDHLALAVGAAELAERCRGNNRVGELGRFLQDLARELRDDAEAMRAILKSVGGTENPVKEAAAWLLEKAGRLKMNDAVFGYSDLSRVEELEGLLLAMQGIQAFWCGLYEADVTPQATLTHRERGIRAARRREDLAKHHREAARGAFLAEAV